MTTMGLGAAKRQAINETVRLRMAALLPTGDEPVGGLGGSSAPGAAPAPGVAVATAPATGAAVGAATSTVGERPATGPPPGPAPPLPDAGAADPGVGVDPPDTGVRPKGGPFAPFAPVMALDRRAVAGLVILLLFAVGYAVQHFWLARPETVAVPAPTAASALSGVPAQAPGDTAPGAVPSEGGTVVPGVGDGTGSGVGPGAGAPVVVDIGGRVHLPGLHTLPGGSRVADALRAAGGVLPETDTRNLNLARVLTDGEQLLVGEQAPAPAAPATGAGNGPPPPAAPRPPVSLNRATLEQLDTLPGVGPTLAQRILAYRTSHGSFRSLEQLRQVSGIGARTYAELRPLLTL
ncbi:helix-hairpin-helix domain-containing protein [Kitasatospora xanthocidica]|uniref:helix-hairpin-helix domain-containing protein n=1 Tax=Kitasatospora xanthocidica TaxID=83382 RepID=UPI0036E80D83